MAAGSEITTNPIWRLPKWRPEETPQETLTSVVPNPHSELLTQQYQLTVLVVNYGISNTLVVYRHSLPPCQRTDRFLQARLSPVSTMPSPSVPAVRSTSWKQRRSPAVHSHPLTWPTVSLSWSLKAFL